MCTQARCSPRQTELYKGDAWRALSTLGTRLLMAKRRWKSAGSTADIELILEEFFVPNEGFVQDDGAHPLMRKHSVYSSYQLAMCLIAYLSSPCWVPVLVPVFCADLMCRNMRILPCMSSLLYPHSWPSCNVPPSLAFPMPLADTVFVLMCSRGSGPCREPRKLSICL